MTKPRRGKVLAGHDKAAAWLMAADELERVFESLVWTKGNRIDKHALHVVEVIVPSLRRRADIISRNARSR